ncbi:MAG: aldehyde dehydrogenase family protein [Candidatus Melainabacteria bacterium]|nr:aldehyde dehydrogenase family protein [Candidatus Melainabacteria bacterium]
MADILEVRSPFDGAVISELELASEARVEEALTEAWAHFDNRSLWLPPYRRIEILERLAALMEKNKDTLIFTALEEGGKPYVDTAIEVDRAIQGVKLAAQAVGNLSGTQVPMGLTRSSTERLAFTFFEPAGVVVSISAFNHPVNLIIHQTVTAIAAGCPVIVKPALATPNSCLEVVRLIHEAGLPEAWCRAIVCSDELAERLATDARVGYLSFIGSARVGWYLRSRIAAGTRCGLEHGGAAPVVVDETADFDAMIPLLVKGGFYHAGQVCVSVQRIFAPRAHAEHLAGLIASQAGKLKVGDPADRTTDVGPLIAAREVDRIESWVAEAARTGGIIAGGGERLESNCFQPTVILDPAVNTHVSTQEIFGPVVCIYSYDSIDQAIDQANSLPFAFQASVFTRDLDRALYAGQRLDATAVMVNDHTAFRVDWMPFGGRDDSGLGLGGIPYSVREMSREKMLVFKSPGVQ